MFVNAYVPHRFTFHSRSPYHSRARRHVGDLLHFFSRILAGTGVGDVGEITEARGYWRFAASAPSPPNSQEKATKTSATGALAVQPNKGEMSRRVCAVGFHARVGPMVKLCNGSPRVSLTVVFLYSISMPTFRRSLGRRIGVITACEKPHSRPRSPVFSFSKNQFMAHSTCSQKSWARSKRNS